MISGFDNIMLTLIM